MLLGLSQIQQHKKTIRSRARHPIYATGSEQLGERAILINQSLVKFCSGTSLKPLADGILLSACSQRAQLATWIL